MKETSKGLKFNRTEREPDELIMAQEWDRYLTTGIGGSGNRPDALDHILDPGIDSTPDRCSARDRAVASTVIQWLGSAVGKGFITDALEKINLESQRRFKTEMAARLAPNAARGANNL